MPNAVPGNAKVLIGGPIRESRIVRVIAQTAHDADQPGTTNHKKWVPHPRSSGWVFKRRVQQSLQKPPKFSRAPNPLTPFHMIAFLRKRNPAAPPPVQSPYRAVCLFRSQNLLQKVPS
jgi:hypothetical protein